ncbi:snaclec subunit A-like [Drosophila santomea]|uniref:snaclec subunit A-like n=1 Tax=Drosophila santomea TaxID=129105 RepID=UPI001954B3C4|nr:snaclec subunit A-like [Drosophila santomea]
MFRLHIGFLCLVVAFCILFGVCHATSDSICVLSDAPQQCAAFCLAALHPLYDQCSKSRQQDNSQEAMVKMIEDFRTEQKELVTHYYQDVRELLNVLAANLTSTASRHESTLQSIPVTVPPGFQKIGSKYFLIEDNEWKSWTGAEETCREKGGRLAAFRNEDEFEAVTRIAHKRTVFWLGYRRNSKDVFVTATGNEGSFMKWKSGQPDNKNGKQNCVALSKSRMYDRKCDHTYAFICQLDTV